MKGSAEKQIKDQELAAVIAAAISIYEEECGQPAGSFAIRRVTRLSGNAWGQAGIADCMKSRRVD